MKCHYKMHKSISKKVSLHTAHTGKCLIKCFKLSVVLRKLQDLTLTHTQETCVSTLTPESRVKLKGIKTLENWTHTLETWVRLMLHDSGSPETWDSRHVRLTPQNTPVWRTCMPETQGLVFTYTPENWTLQRLKWDSHYPRDLTTLTQDLTTICTQETWDMTSDSTLTQING